MKYLYHYLLIMQKYSVVSEIGQQNWKNYGRAKNRRYVLLFAKHSVFDTSSGESLPSLQ